MLRHIAHGQHGDPILKIEIPMPVLLLEKRRAYRAGTYSNSKMAYFESCH
jgi:hypothetical protein